MISINKKLFLILLAVLLLSSQFVAYAESENQDEQMRLGVYHGALAEYDSPDEWNITPSVQSIDRSQWLMQIISEIKETCGIYVFLFAPEGSSLSFDTAPGEALSSKLFDFYLPAIWEKDFGYEKGQTPDTLPADQIMIGYNQYLNDAIVYIGSDTEKVLSENDLSAVKKAFESGAAPIGKDPEALYYHLYTGLAELLNCIFDNAEFKYESGSAIDRMINPTQNTQLRAAASVDALGGYDLEDNWRFVPNQENTNRSNMLNQIISEIYLNCNISVLLVAPNQTEIDISANSDEELDSLLLGFHLPNIWENDFGYGKNEIPDALPEDQIIIGYDQFNNNAHIYVGSKVEKILSSNDLSAIKQAFEIGASPFGTNPDLLYAHLCSGMNDLVLHIFENGNFDYKVNPQPYTDDLITEILEKNEYRVEVQPADGTQVIIIAAIAAAVIIAGAAVFIKIFRNKKAKRQ